MSIPFTQYIRPNGRAITTHIDRPREIERKAAELRENGYFFEAEVLTTGEVSLTCEDADDVISISIVPNGPEVLKAVDQIVEVTYDLMLGGRREKDAADSVSAAPSGSGNGPKPRQSKD